MDAVWQVGGRQIDPRPRAARDRAAAPAATVLATCVATGAAVALRTPGAVLVAWLLPLVVIGQYLAARIAITTAVRRVTGAPPTLDGIAAALAGALGSRTVDITFAGRPHGHRIVSDVVAPDGSFVAAVGLDPGPRWRPDRVRTVLVAARLALENARLLAAFETELERARVTRRDVAAAALTQRHRVERILHDGAQQALLTTAVRLELLCSGPAVPSGTRDGLADASTELRGALRELRHVAATAFPPLLAACGPAGALEALGERLPLDVTVVGDGRRCDAAAEAAAYFAVADVLTDLSLADGCRSARVALARCHDVFRVELEHDGGRGAPGARVRTLVVDRLAAFDGSARFVDGNRPGIVVEVPCR